jgi:ATP-dependent RNA helicase DDX24/MAK5
MPTKLRKVNLKTKIWNSLPWRKVSLEDKVFGDFDESILFELEEIDGNDYKLTKSETGYTLSLPDIIDCNNQREDDDINQAKDSNKATKKLLKKDKKNDKNQVELKNIKNDSKLIISQETLKWENVELNVLLTNALIKLGFDTPTPIQREAIPISMKGECDIIGAAETGSGKTLAFVLPILNYILIRSSKDNGDNQSDISGIIIAPTRELALQITKVCKDICECFQSYKSVTVVSIVGGMSEQKQRRLLGLHGKPPDIIVGTPGRLCEMIQDEEITIFQDMSRYVYELILYNTIYIY